MTRAGTGTVSRPLPEWRRIVDQLNTAADRGAFLEKMLELQCLIVAARYGAIWQINAQQKPQLVKAWPPELAQAPPNATVTKMLAEAAQSGAQKGTTHILKIESPDPHQTHEAGTHVFVTVMRSQGQVAAVSTVVADCRDDKAANATGPMRELAAGLYETFDAKQNALDFEQEAKQIRWAMALLAVSQEGRGFKGSCLNLVNELARQLQCTRVSLGWVKGRSVRAVNVSGTEHLKRHSEQVTTVEMAMTECLDQQQPIVYPIPDNAEPLLAHVVVHDHRRLAGSDPTLRVVSIPLRSGDDWIGVLTLERSGHESADFDPALIRQLQLIGDVVGPYLQDRRRSSRNVIVHTWHTFTELMEYLVGPKHVAWKLGGIALLVLLTYACVGVWPYKVTASFVLEADSKRIIPAPYESPLAEVWVEPGDIVQPGAALAKLRDTELVLELAEAQSQLKIASLEKARATAEGKLADAQQAQARADQAQAQIDLLQYRIDQSTIRSPIKGVVLAGFWRDKVGGVIDQGEPMFEVAPVEDLVALVRVDESDINEVDLDPLPSGRMSTRSEPEQEFEIHTKRIVPLATPVEGENVFELRCRIKEPADWLRPGMEGIAKLSIEDRPIIWVLTHRIADTIRLWTWTWSPWS